MRHIIRPGFSLTPALLVVLLLAPLASAHVPHRDQSVQDGFLHPISGVDHVLAMVAVGLLAVGLKRNWLWALPATFVISMLVGATLGIGGLLAPSWLAEAGIAGSVFGFGLLIMLGAPLPPLMIAALTAAFALCHGSAHAAEMTPDTSVAGFFAGFALSTLGLHAAGVGLGLLLGRSVPVAAVRACGMAMTVCGVLLFAGKL
ncbi:MAG TPA: HupE/UreJ family protein [Tepidisphaeraceae bacterium]|jgi:urease accessory protein